ncbi:MAG: alpha/beta hydrolase [Polyangiaceae bacterium]|nr:alpha/beta hydrolase [Polyangiaceae bacterium]
MVIPNSVEERDQAGITEVDVSQAVEYYRTRADRTPAPPTSCGSPAWAPSLAFDAFHLVEDLLTQPIQIITGDVAGAFGSMQEGRDLFDRVKSEKDLYVVEGATHYDLYDRPEPVAKAIAKLAPFYRKHL